MRHIQFWVVIALLLVGAGGAQADLVGYWPLNGDGVDVSGLGHDGTVNGNVAPVMDRFRNPIGAMYFPGGSSDNINVGDSPDFQMSGAMTITAWVYLDSTNPLHLARNGRILGKMGGGGSRAWSTGIEKNVNGVPVPATVQIAGNGNTVVGLSDDSPLPLDRWVHYAGVYTPGESLVIYLNGELAAIRIDGIPASQYSTNGQAVLIGHRPACGDCGWYGALDEVRIYNEALSEAQIESLMWGSSAGDPDPADAVDRVPVNPILSWRAPDPEWLADPNGGVQYVVYFDPNELLVTSGDESVRFGPQSETELTVGPDALELATTYYWRVDVIDPNFGDPLLYPGVVWSFTTLPPKAGLISPENGAADVGQNAVLEWDPGFGAIEHDVYFGTDEALVTAGDPAVYIGRQSEAFFDPDLDWQTQYFWRIDEIFTPGGIPEVGDVWNFTTTIAICEYVLEGDIDNNCVVNLEDLAFLANNWLVCNLTNGDCP